MRHTKVTLFLFSLTCIQLLTLHSSFSLDFSVIRTDLLGSSSDWNYSVDVGDIENDGDLDIVVGVFGGQNKVYINNGLGEFPTTKNFGTGTDSTYCVLLIDIDGDNDKDIVTGNDGQNAIYINNFNVVLNDSFHFLFKLHFGTGTDFTRAIIAGDIDNDFKPDIITGNYEEQNVIYEYQGYSDFTALNFGTGSDKTQSLALADINHDATPDIIVGNAAINTIYLGNSFGTSIDFGEESDHTSGLVAVDTDYDGDTDILAGNSNSANALYLNDGNGNLTVSSNFWDEDHNTSSIALGDLNQDSKLDIVVGNEGSSTNNIYIYFHQSGDVYSSTAALSSTTKTVSSLQLDDLDGDGDKDIVSSQLLDTLQIHFNASQPLTGDALLLTDRKVWPDPSTLELGAKVRVGLKEHISNSENEEDPWIQSLTDSDPLSNRGLILTASIEIEAGNSYAEIIFDGWNDSTNSIYGKQFDPVYTRARIGFNDVTDYLDFLTGAVIFSDEISNSHKGAAVDIGPATFSQAYEFWLITKLIDIKSGGVAVSDLQGMGSGQSGISTINEIKAVTPLKLFR